MGKVEDDRGIMFPYVKTGCCNTLVEAMKCLQMPCGVRIIVRYQVSNSLVSVNIVWTGLQTSMQ